MCYIYIMSDSSFTFVDELPPRPDHLLNRRQPDALILDFAEACKDNVGRWCTYPKPLSPATRRTYATAINHQGANVPACLGTGEFEATNRDGQLYVRCKPEGLADSAKPY